MNLQQRMQHDLEFLKQAFPHLSQEFANGEWVGQIQITDELGNFIPEATGNHGFFEIGFQVQFPRVNRLGHGYTIRAYILSIDCETTKSGNPYTLRLMDGTYLDFPSVYSAAEFIGRKAHALTPIDASAAALEARFGGAS